MGEKRLIRRPVRTHTHPEVPSHLTEEARFSLELIDRLLAEAENDKKPHQSVEFFVAHLLNLRVDHERIIVRRREPLPGRSLRFPSRGLIAEFLYELCHALL